MFLATADLLCCPEQPRDRPPASPFELRHYLLDRFSSGQDVCSAVQEYRKRTGDHSFDALEEPSPGKLRAMKLAREAKQAWIKGDFETAMQTYARVHALLSREEARSEMGFCLYYSAEILSEQERYEDALQLADLGLSAAGECPYLAALLQESRGYSLWYMDRLQPAARAFSQAAELWLSLDFPDGLVGAWNNLALLYQAMRLTKQASYCFERALEFEPSAKDSAILFQLHGNYASFLAEQGFQNEAAEELEKAQRLGEADPAELLLLECRLRSSPEDRDRLARFRPHGPSLEIERNLLLGEIHFSDDEACAFLRRSLELSVKHQLRHHRRRSVLALGNWLESRERWAEAMELYLEGFRLEENLHAPEFLFPYSRVVSPLFDGWVRCLVRTGRTGEARAGIRRFTDLRKQKAEQVLRRSATWQPTNRSDLGYFSQATGLELEAAPIPSWDSQPPPSQGALESAGITGASLIELWPDRDRVYAWVTTAREDVFEELKLSASATDMIEPLLEAVYSPSDYLPRVPGSSSLCRLYAELFEPLIRHITSNALLVIPHKELQSLPIEILKDREGRYLAQIYTVSYLPSRSLPLPLAPSGEGPVAVFPDSTPALPMAGRERHFFRDLVPNIRILSAIPDEGVGNPTWLHVSGHFLLDPDFWIGSAFLEGRRRTGPQALLDATRSCSLLSLGVCHAGNSYSSASPYWLGFAELFLARGVSALLVSRWALDDLSMRIYRDFYVCCRQGMAMDEALALAKRRFLGLRLERNGVTAPGSHPYFWGGVAYIGSPGARLYDPVLFIWPLWLTPLAAASATGILALTRRRPEKPPAERQ